VGRLGQHPGPGEAAERVARGGEGQTVNGLKFLLSQGLGVRSTCDNGARRLKQAARGTAPATSARRARLTMRGEGRKRRITS